jgi:predicted Zn finger-like uncharacterized protein
MIMATRYTLALALCASLTASSEAFAVAPFKAQAHLSCRTFASLSSTPLADESNGTDLSATEATPPTEVAADADSPSPLVGSAENPITYVRCGKCQTVYTLTPDDLGFSKGRRLECSVCNHSWFQSKDRLLTVQEGFQLVPLPQEDLQRINTNIEQGKAASFLGEIKIYVGNIAFECHEDDIYQLFSQVGEVGEVSLVRDATGKNRGFGFVTMRTRDGGLEAIEKLDGSPVRGRRLSVRESTN